MNDLQPQEVRVQAVPFRASVPRPTVTVRRLPGWLGLPVLVFGGLAAMAALAFVVVMSALTSGLKKRETLR